MPFKYENLPTFCFGCGILGYGIKKCGNIFETDKNKSDDELLYSIALRAKFNLMGKESLHFGLSNKKIMKQCLYTGQNNSTTEKDDSIRNVEEDDRNWRVIDRSEKNVFFKEEIKYLETVDLGLTVQGKMETGSPKLRELLIVKELTFPFIGTDQSNNQLRDWGSLTHL